MPARTLMSLSAAFRIACTSGDPGWVIRAITAALTNTLGPLRHALRPLIFRACWLLVKAAHAVLIIVKVIVKTAWWIAIKLVALVSNILNFPLLGLSCFGATIATIVLYILYPQQVTDYAIVLGYLKQGFELGKEKAKEAWQSDMGQKVARFVDAALDALPGALRKAQSAAEGAWNMLAALIKEIKEMLGYQSLGTYRRLRVD